MLRLVEKEHYEALLKDNQSNLKNSWRILKEVIYKKKHTILNSRFIINNNIVTDKNLYLRVLIPSLLILVRH